METSVALCPQGHVGVKRFLEGELVEVRQREKGLRGSWHPAVVIGVKAGRRVVEYDELLTDDGREKLTENIPVARGLDGGKLAGGRLPWKSPGKRSRALLRPRPPPLPDPSSINWTKGLSVDCYFQDAWWEGVLTEAISNSSRQKRAVVWFPEEEDWESIALKDMRVGQQWDEDTGLWSLKGCLDIPVSRRGNRSRTMSLGNQTRRLVRNQRRKSSHDMELAIALKIDESGRADRKAEQTSASNNVGRTSDDVDTVESVKVNFRTSAAIAGLRANAAEIFPRDEWKEQESLPLGVQSRTAESFPRRIDSLRGRILEGSVFSDASYVEEQEGACCGHHDTVKIDQGKVGDREPLMRSGVGALDKEVLFDEEQTYSTVSKGKDSGEAIDKGPVGDGSTEIGNAEKDSPQALRRAGSTSLPTSLVDDDRKGRRLLEISGWEVTENVRKGGAMQWHYRSPNGCLLGSLESAIAMLRQMNEDQKNWSGDDENPTLSDMKSPTYGRRKRRPFPRIANGDMVHCNRLVQLSEGGNDVTGQESDEVEPGTPGPEGVEKINVMVGTPDISGHTLGPGNADSTGFSPLLNLHCKRNALESELIVEPDVNELKRRKIEVSPSGHSEPNGFQVSLSSGRSERDTDVADTVPPLQTSALIPSRPADFEKTLYDGGVETSAGFLDKRNKKRTCLTEDTVMDHSPDIFDATSKEDTTRIHDGADDQEPRTKKSRVISNELSSPFEGKSRKSLAILQENSRKKGPTALKSGDLKQAKKGTTQVKKSAAQVKKGKKSRTPARAGVRLEVLLSSPGSTRDPSLGEGELTRKRTLLSWLIDNRTVVEHERVRYLHRKDFHTMLEGQVTRDGILCDCCKKVVTLSVFEAHAGSKLHRPSANIFLLDGRSLSDCQVAALAHKTQKESVSEIPAAEPIFSIDKSDDTCGVCGDGGELICCDHCPSTFHLKCMGLQKVPDGDWYCPNCRCASCGGSQFNGNKTAFNDLTVIFCDQCECEYHVKCLRARGFELNSLPEDEFFCGCSCERIFQGLRGLVGACKAMEGGFSWTLLRSSADDDRKAGRVSISEINAEHDSKLSIALSVMQECFRPMIDPRTKIDIITHVLYNRRSEVSRLNYHGFYTMLLERGDELISVATIRVHGSRLAEMPLVGTRFQYRRQGMCRRLMHAIEEMLEDLGVERLVLPAVPELLETWTGAFGFRPLNESERLELMDLNIMAFPGTSMLYKQLGRMEPPGKLTAANESGYVHMIQHVSQKESDVAVTSQSVIAKRGRGRPPKIKMETISLKDGVTLAPSGAQQLTEVGQGHPLEFGSSYFVSPKGGQPGHSDLLNPSKRGRGRPPKAKGVVVKSRDGLTLAASVAVAGVHQLAEAGRDAAHTCDAAESEGVFDTGSYLEPALKDEGPRQEFEAVPTVRRRKRGRPPRARSNYNSTIGILSSTAAEVGLEQVTGFRGGEVAALMYRPASSTVGATAELPPLSSENGIVVNERNGFSGGTLVDGTHKHISITGSCFDSKLQKDGELRSKRKPVNSRTVNILNSVLGIGTGQAQEASEASCPDIEDIGTIPSQRSPEVLSPASEDKGVDEQLSDSAVIRKTTRTMREVKTPLWLIESVSEDPKAGPRTKTQTGESSWKALTCQTGFLARESKVSSSTKTYERRKTKVSTQSLRIHCSVVEREVRERALHFSDEEEDLEPAALLNTNCGPVSVPIRTFPSQFASSGHHHNMPPGTFIPVETIVVNSCPRVESTSNDEFRLSETSKSEREEQKGGAQLLLKLKLTEETKLALSSCDTEKASQPSTLMQRSVIAMHPPSLRVPELHGKGLKRFDQGQMKQQVDSALGPHYIPVSVS